MFTDAVVVLLEICSSLEEQLKGTQIAHTGETLTPRLGPKTRLTAHQRILLSLTWCCPSFSKHFTGAPGDTQQLTGASCPPPLQTYQLYPNLPNNNMTSRPSSTDAAPRPLRKTTTMSGAQALAAINTEPRAMPVQEFAVPPRNQPIMEFSQTAPALSRSRQTIRDSMRKTEVKHHEEIQATASMDAKARRKRTMKMNSIMNFHRDR